MDEAHSLKGGGLSPFYMLWELCGAIVASHERRVLTNDFYGCGDIDFEYGLFGSGRYIGYSVDGVGYGSGAESMYQDGYDYRRILQR